MGHAAACFYLGPPYAAVADTNTVHVQGFRNDHVIDTGR